ncbi:MAG: P-loop NTPase [Clostridia bacterium]|nr:P-loop NTPase [Clostridia bacterium]
MISIVLVSKQAGVCRTLRDYLSTDPQLDLLAELSNTDEALEKVDLLSPNILMIHTGESDTDAISLAERVIQRKPRTFVILLMQPLTLERTQAANAAGCHNIAPFPQNAKELCDFVHRVHNTENDRITALDTNERATWSSKIITVYGAKGGLGKTTIATNLAVMLAKQKKKVAILDLDLLFGDVHVFMDLEPKETIADLMQERACNSIDAVRAFMTVHSSGIHILCAPKTPEYAETVSGDRVQSLLALLRSYYDYIIIDTAVNFSDPVLAALEASTTILFLTGLDVSILKNSKTALSILESLGQKKKVRVIINRAVEINSITVSDVQRIVDAPILARIPSDYLVAVAALNQGQPFAQNAPKAKLSLAISDIAEKIITGNDQFDIQKLSSRERRALMRRYKTKDKAEKKARARL